MKLGERESGTARLEEAVTAYRAALTEFTRERAPLDWAMTQYNLGTTLERLGERESGTARLEEAVTAGRAALDRERKKEGKRVITCDVSAAQIEALAAAGFLDLAIRDDAAEVARGVGRLIDRLARSGPVASASALAKAAT